MSAGEKERRGLLRTGGSSLEGVCLAAAGVGVLQAQVHPAKWSLDSVRLEARAGRWNAQQRQVSEEDVVSSSSISCVCMWSGVG